MGDIEHLLMISYNIYDLSDYKTKSCQDNEDIQYSGISDIQPNKIVCKNSYDNQKMLSEVFTSWTPDCHLWPIWHCDKFPSRTAKFHWEPALLYVKSNP